MGTVRLMSRLSRGAAPVAGPTLDVTREQIIAFRRRTGALDERLPPGPASLGRAAWAGLQDSVPRSASHSLHARVAATAPDAWEDPSLVQAWGLRYTAYVVPAGDHAPFTLGRLPDEGRTRRVAEDLAARLHAYLKGRRLDANEAGRGLGIHPNALRYAAMTGTVLIRWDGARRPTVWTVPRPELEPLAARIELARRYLRTFGPATPGSCAGWPSRLGPAPSERRPVLLAPGCGSRAPRHGSGAARGPLDAPCLAGRPPGRRRCRRHVASVRRRRHGPAVAPALPAGTRRRRGGGRDPAAPRGPRRGRGPLGDRLTGPMARKLRKPTPSRLPERSTSSLACRDARAAEGPLALGGAPSGVEAVGRRPGRLVPRRFLLRDRRRRAATPVRPAGAAGRARGARGQPRDRGRAHQRLARTRRPRPRRAARRAGVRATAGRPRPTGRAAIRGRRSAAGWRRGAPRDRAAVRPHALGREPPSDRYRRLAYRQRHRPDALRPLDPRGPDAPAGPRAPAPTPRVAGRDRAPDARGADRPRRPRARAHLTPTRLARRRQSQTHHDFRNGGLPRRRRGSIRCGGFPTSGTPARAAPNVPASRASISPVTWAPA